MDRERVIALAERAGFGGNQRNTLLVKLMLLAKLVEQEEREACAKLAELGDEGEWSKTTGDFDSCRGRDIANAIRMRSNVQAQRPEAASPPKGRAGAAG